MNGGDFTGRSGLVTGAGSGIGRASVLEFCRRGASVAVVDVDGAAAEETVARCRDLPGRAIALTADVSDPAAVEAMVARTNDALGPLDFAFNNAATMGETVPLAEMDYAAWQHVMRINVDSVFLCMRAELSVMQRRGGGVIVNAASNAGLFAVAGMPAYVASKHAVVGLSKAAAVDYGRHGIRVVALCPGSTDTPMLAAQLSGDDAAVASRMGATPLGRLADPREVARTAVWLCSDDASFITGETIRVDGGRRA